MAMVYMGKSDPSSHIHTASPTPRLGLLSNMACCGILAHNAAMNCVSTPSNKPGNAPGYLSGLTLISTNLFFQILPMRLEGLIRNGRRQHTGKKKSYKCAPKRSHTSQGDTKTHNQPNHLPLLLPGMLIHAQTL